MRSIGVRELRQRASELLRLVEQGESFEVTNSNRPVARLVPRPKVDSWAAMLEQGDVVVHSKSLEDLRPCERSCDGRRGPPPYCDDFVLMSVERLVYLDSSAIVKLVVHEPESSALMRHLRRRRLVASALARTEVMRSVLSLDAEVVVRARDVLRSIDLVRVADRILEAAGELAPFEMRSLDAIHIATALALGASVNHVVTYDDRMAKAARAVRLRVIAPK